MSCHLLVVSEKKIKMLKTPFVIAHGEVLRWRHSNFPRMTHLDYKHVLGQNQMHYAGSYALYI